jgi:hypothetical protein
VIRTITQDEDIANRPAPDIENVKLDEGSEEPKGDTIVVEVPPRSFTVIEVAIATP